MLAGMTLLAGMTVAGRNGVRRGYRDLGAMPVSECFDLDGVDSFEVFAVVCQDGEIVVDRGATDQQIEVADGCALELGFRVWPWPGASGTW